MLREWLKANGGPPAVVLVGVALLAVDDLLGIAVIGLGVVLALWRWDRIRRLVPWRIVRTRDLVARAQSDAEIAERALQQAKSLGVLLGQHARYSPPLHSERDDDDPVSHAAWARRVNESRRHDQATVGRFFEEQYADVMALATELHERGALTDDEVRHLNWSIGTSTLGASMHQLAEVPRILLTGSQRLRGAEPLPKRDASDDSVGEKASG